VDIIQISLPQGVASFAKSAATPLQTCKPLKTLDSIIKIENEHSSRAPLRHYRMK
jgi:hypothetical protein